MKPDPEQIAIEPKLAESDSPHIPLGEYVRVAVEQYFQQINGYPAGNLYEFVVGTVEKPLIEIVLKQVGHNQSKAAKTLGISRSTLRKKIDRFGLG